MSERRSAEEWATRCMKDRHTTIIGGVYSDGKIGMCPECARAYAREVGEAVREEAATMSGRFIGLQHLAAAIRQIEVKPP